MALLLKSSNYLRLYSPIKNVLRFCSSQLAEKKGLVLGVYSNDNDGVELTPAAECYNQISQGRLLEQIQLSVLF